MTILICSEYTRCRHKRALSVPEYRSHCLGAGGSGLPEAAIAVRGQLEDIISRAHAALSSHPENLAEAARRRTHQMKPNELQNHMLATYATLRIGVAVIAIVFPLVLSIGGALLNMPLQDSMSAYYHANCDGYSMRNWFVGILFAVGIILYLYKGYSSQENYALNIAGVLAICVAIIPMKWACGEVCGTFCEAEHEGLTLHGICAFSFFICIAYVCIFRASDTLRLMKNERRERRYQRLYRWFGALMIVSPFSALLLTVLFDQYQRYAFVAEAAGIWIFAAYWMLKSREISVTSAERRVLREEIEI